MTSRVYLDHNASAPLRSAARARMLEALECPGNPSSGHAEGRAARRFVEDARRQVAALVGADPRGVVFTSGATEAANLAVTPSLVVGGRSPTRLLAGATEHPCVAMGHRFAELTTVPVTADGALRLDRLAEALQGAPAMLALQHANGESGVIQPVRAAADLVHGAGGLVVCDAVQTAGRLLPEMADLGADIIILSSHKIGGPKGAGALVFADPDATIGTPLVRGGGQERGLRSGTTDVAAIAGFGAACADVASCGRGESARSLALRDAFEEHLSTLAPAFILGRGAPRLPNTSCFSLPGVASATLLMTLDLAGIAISAGSACSSGKLGRSPLLDAMGVDPHMSGMLRVSFGWTSREDDVAALCGAIRAVLPRLERGRAA